MPADIYLPYTINTSYKPSSHISSLVVILHLTVRSQYKNESIHDSNKTVH